MPQVPREQATMLPSATPGVRVQPVATPQAFGAGIANVGEDLGLAVFSKATREANQSAVLAADRRLAQSQTELQLKIADMRGRDAMGAVDVLDDEWQKVVDGISEQEIHNDQQRLAFQRAAADRYQALNKSTQVHMHQERNRWQDEETDAYIKTSQDSARLSASNHDMEGIEREKGRQRGALMQWAERHGLGKWVDAVPPGPGAPESNPNSHQWINLLSPAEVDEGRIADENAVRGPGMFVEGKRPPERTFQGTPEFERKWAELVSKTNTEVVKGLLYTGQDLKADEYYKANKADFVAADRDGIEKVIEEGSYRGRALRLSRLMIDSNMDRKEALQILDTIEDPKLHQVARELVLQRYGDQEVADDKGAIQEANKQARTIIAAKLDRKEAIGYVDEITDPKVRKLVRDQVVEHFGDTAAAEEADAKSEAAKRARQVLDGKMDRTDALAYVDKIEDPKLQKFTRELVLQHFQDAAAADKEAHDQRFDAAKQRVDQAIQKSPGREINPRLTVGPDAWIALKPEEQNSLMHMAREAMHPTDRANDDNKWFEFHSVLTPEQVAKLSPREYQTKYRDHFSNGFRQVADTYYNTIRNAVDKKEQKDPHLSETQTFKDQVEDSFRTSGLLGSVNEPTSKWTEAERSMYVKYERQAAAAIEQEELSKGKKLTPTEKQVLIDRVKDAAVKKLWVRRGFFGFEREVPQIGLEENEKQQAVVPVDQIPTNDVTELRNYITSLGKTVTTDKLRRAYAQRILNNRKAFDAIVNE